MAADDEPLRPESVGSLFLASLHRPGQNLVLHWGDDGVEGHYISIMKRTEESDPVSAGGPMPWQAEILGSRRPGLHWVTCEEGTGARSLVSAVTNSREGAVLAWDRPGVMTEKATEIISDKGPVVTYVEGRAVMNGGRVEALRALARRRPEWILARKHEAPAGVVEATRVRAGVPAERRRLENVE
jgi:hypothetical protein